MNLDNLNLVELNAQEVQEVEGGSFWKDVASVAGYIYETYAIAARTINRVTPANGGNATIADK